MTAFDNGGNNYDPLQEDMELNSDIPVSSCTSIGTFTPTANNSSYFENNNNIKFHPYCDNLDDPLQH